MGVNIADIFEGGEGVAVELLWGLQGYSDIVGLEVILGPITA
jgi:hypothetical protein